MKKTFEPIFPDLTKPYLINGFSQMQIIETEWVMRKHEIRKVLSAFLRQREAAYKAYDMLTIERAHAFITMKAELKNITALYSEKYILSLKAFLTKCQQFMPFDEKLFQTWEKRFEKINKYCDKFLTNTQKTK